MTGDGPGNDNPRALPGFDEPWQAQAHAMSQVLLESGRIEANVWAETLGAAIRKRLASGAADMTETYYAALTDALETVLAVDGQELADVAEAWRDAYETTPHGKPVLLKTVKSE